MKAVDLAKWFIYKNPNLSRGYVDENTKLNKLVYFSNLMYYSLKNENLIEDNFERWDHGPVVREIYKSYRYGDLSSFQTTESPISTSENEDLNKILNVIEFVYGEKKSEELSEETHEHNIWINSEKNDDLDINKINESIKNRMRTLYELYSNLDFESIGKEKIAGNLYYFNKKEFEVTDDDIIELSDVPHQEYPIFLEKMDGELVFS